MSYALVEATFAAARRYLKEARTHEQLALGYASCQYMPGFSGTTARRLYRLHDERRATAIRLALETRDKAKRLRARFAELATDDTIPPQQGATP